MRQTLHDIAEMGEEDGREEAADEFPFLPHDPDRCLLTWRGRAYAHRLYGLLGKKARVFAQNWAMGYAANVALYEEDYPEALARARESMAN